MAKQFRLEVASAVPSLCNRHHRQSPRLTLARRAQVLLLPARTSARSSASPSAAAVPSFLPKARTDGAAGQVLKRDVLRS